MLASALGAISDRLDAKFLIAYWLPAFVAVLGGCGILTVLIGGARIEAWLYDLDSVEQTWAVVLILLAITMVAFILRALTRPITEAFAGEALPRSVANWSARGQRQSRLRAQQKLSAIPQDDASDSTSRRARQVVGRAYPLDDAELRPTRFGNVLATAVEYPRLTYTMLGLIWWPRLSPLVPVEFQEMLGGAQAPMMALLNLSVVFTTLALGGAAALALAGGHWIAAIAVLGGGLLLAWLCYRAGVSQAAEVASLLRVGFDLYRHDILRQMDLEIPPVLAEERALWSQLTQGMLDPVDRAAVADAAPSEAASTGQAATDAS